MDERISVAEVLELGVVIAWQQAVAVTLEAWHVAVNAHVRQQPVQLDTESCVLTLKGDVILPRLATVHQPDGALQLLRAMLDGIEAPPDLVEVAFGTSAATLSDDLALFSRPNRRIEIADVVQRALAARAALAASTPMAEAAAASVAPPLPDSPSAPDEAFATLRQEAAARAPVVPAKASEPVAPTPQRRWGLALACAAVTIMAGAVWRMWPDPAPAPVMEVVVDDALTEPSPPDPAWSAAGERTADVHLARRPATKTAAAPGSTSAPRTDAPAAAVVPGAPPAPAAATDATFPPPGETSPEGATRGSAGDEATAVYTWKSDGVEPPTMVFPRMPRAAFPEPDDDIHDQPYVEVLVNERGSVDAVRMRGNVGASDVVRHGMMLAAAKAWQFAPATRNGQPVRYVVRVLLGQ